ncbi:MAG: hypothetical protein PHY05_05925 [Methanothrix sp.]|nr:hypothetical protein [Methanothrix sp.]
MMNPIDHRLGCEPSSGSTLSPAIVISGRSVKRLVNRTCEERRGRNGRNRESRAMLNMFPNGQSLLRIAVCIMMYINEEWMTGRKYLSLEE